MKRYISGVLIPCFLLQLFGCYSFKDITINELREYKGANEIKIKTNQKEVLIKRKSGEISPMYWEANDSLITIKTKELIKWQDYNKLIDKVTEIKYYEIESVEIEELNILTTALLTAGIVGIIALGIAASQIPGVPEHGILK